MIRNHNVVVKHVEFVSYTGKCPNLCRGDLTLRCDRKEYTFKSKTDKFWESGGCLDDGCIEVEGEWIIDTEKLPPELRQYADEIDAVLNENVKHCCCGDCA